MQPSTFPWEEIKAETLRLVCRDLGAGPAIKRTRAEMVTFLQGVENKAVLKDSKAAARNSTLDPEPMSPGVNDRVPGLPVPCSPQLGENHDADAVESDADSDSYMNLHEDSVDHTCNCQEGWLSPRLKFILTTVAAVAYDLILDTGQFAEEFGHVGGVYLTAFIPSDQRPRGKKACALWVEGYATLFKVIHEMFEAGEIPRIDALERCLDQLSMDQKRLIRAYMKWSGEVDIVLEALVHGAKQEWEEDEFEATHCCEEEWDELPVCAEHDLNWTLAEDMLIG